MDEVRLTKPEGTYGILLKAIKSNRKDLAEEILCIDRTYFYDEGSLVIRKESCYLREAISHKNTELLQLLLSYGWPTLIYKDRSDEDEERWQSNLFGNEKQRILIDPKEPFITEDYKILSILIDHIDDINKPYELTWKGKDGSQIVVYMTLLATALYFDRLSIAELLVRKGAVFHFNLFETLAEATRDSYGMGSGLIGSMNNNPLITGYCVRGVFLPEQLEMYYKWSSISIIFQKGNSKLIHWMLQNKKGLPQEMEEIKLAALQLKGDRFEEFAKRYPEIAEKISLKEILRKANHRALRYHLPGMDTMSGYEPLRDFLSFQKQSGRSWEDILTIVMTEDFLLCFKEIIQFVPELIQSEEVQKGIFNLCMFFLYMGNISPKTWNHLIEDSSAAAYEGGEELFSQKNGICRKMAEGLMKYCTFICTKTQDATEFMEWYYDQRYRDPLKDMKNMIKSLLKEKPRLDIGRLDPYYPGSDPEQGHMTLYSRTAETMTQLNDIMDLFTPYDSQSVDSTILLHGFHRAVILKNNPELVKKMAANGYISDANLEPMVSYAVDVRADNILPYLINYKWRRE